MTSNDLISEYKLSLISKDKQTSTGLLIMDESRDMLAFEYADKRIEVVNEDYFEGFCHIREALEAEGLLPICYAASQNVYPSGMSRNMGGGLRAYKLTLGQRGRIADLVDIFSTGPDVIPATVAEQLEYYNRWLASFGDL